MAVQSNCCMHIHDVANACFQSWRYKHADNHGKDMRALEHDHSISNRFSEWRGNLCRPVACRLHQMLTAAISEAATAKATALTKTGMSFPGQAA